ncbi:MULTISPECIES: autotransporter outer membrane beta-barrel domain-containing protein [unclassified Halomonas]|uniref:autotransporter outer membrane beta-barrel domain-containing protein n=1 Tax=unclassified Halomonas TaxID=2609666 RepID=UPI0013F4F1DC|nr:MULTISPECIES: autotransporter outer membrane beta-barrel domain-containing protein [unclassified Halomonas]MBT2787206.1 autotransporter outer membrane beta-barrel domain-containing protein [Halomonas sp. ISL-106]MBT2796430.1 autotransporter outer membrane beta-barrel domain-containing protein [Halomonas sp. ISL-104]
MLKFKQSLLTIAIGAATSVPMLAQAASTLDLAVVIDESGSMAGEHNYIGSYVGNLDNLLNDQGVSLNQYGLVGFGGTNYTSVGANEAGREEGRALYRHFILSRSPDGVWGGAGDFHQETKTLVVNGSFEDGYRAIDYTFRNFDFRDAAGSAIMLISDEDRDIDSVNLPGGMSLIDKAHIEQQLKDNETVVHAVVQQSFSDPEGMNRKVIAVAGDNPATGFSYVEDAQGVITKVEGYQFGNRSLDTTQTDYSELALASGGTVMDIRTLRSVYNDAAALQQLTGALANILVELSVDPIIGINCDNASGNVLQLCAALAQAPELRSVAAEVETSAQLRQLSQYQVNQMVQTAVQNNRAVVQTVRNRLATLRQAGANVVDINMMDYSGDNIALNGETTSNMREIRGGAASGDLNGLGYFMRGTYMHGKQDTTEEANGYSSDTYALVLGVDSYLNDKTQVGVALNYTTTDADFDLASGGTDSDTYGVTLYGSHAVLPNLYLEASAGYAQASFDTERDSGFGTVRGDTDGDIASVSLGALYEHEVNSRLTLQPFTYLNYTNVELDGFEESGGMTALVIDDSRIESLVSQVGASAAYQLTDSLVGVASLAWEHEFENSGGSIASAFASSPDNVFNVKTPEMDSDYGRFGLGLSKGLGLNRTLSVNAEALFAHSDYEEYGIELQFRQEL